MIGLKITIVLLITFIYLCMAITPLLERHKDE